MTTLEKKDIKDIIVTSDEVIKILDISRARLSQLKKNGKLIPIKKNLYYLKDVQERKNIQEDLRRKHYKSKL